MSSGSRRRSSACISPWFLLARNWWDRFPLTPRSNAMRHSVSARHFSHFLMLDWKHFSSRAQWRFLSRMEHQTFDENLKSTEVFNSCHIYGLLFYVLASMEHQLSARTWNQRKFSTRVTCKVYCSMELPNFDARSWQRAVLRTRPRWQIDRNRPLRRNRALGLMR